MQDWTLDEARAYMPRLRRLLGVLRAAAELAAKAPTNGHGGGSGHRSNGHAPAGDPDPDPEEALSELESKGVIVRDLERGLVDFPSLHRGRPVLLCWLVDDEKDIEWWHLPEDGFAGRKRLPLPPEL